MSKGSFKVIIDMLGFPPNKLTIPTITDIPALPVTTVVTITTIVEEPATPDPDDVVSLGEVNTPEPDDDVSLTLFVGVF